MSEVIVSANMTFLRRRADMIWYQFSSSARMRPSALQITPS
jgi:hypothetical protein